MEVTGSIKGCNRALQAVIEFTTYFPELCIFANQWEASMKLRYQLSFFKFWKQNLVERYGDFGSKETTFEQNTELQVEG